MTTQGKIDVYRGCSFGTPVVQCTKTSERFCSVYRNQSCPHGSTTHYRCCNDHPALRNRTELWWCFLVPYNVHVAGPWPPMCMYIGTRPGVIHIRLYVCIGCGTFQIMHNQPVMGPDAYTACTCYYSEVFAGCTTNPSEQARPAEYTEI